jgi:hypothetical protein
MDGVAGVRFLAIAAAAALLYGAARALPTLACWSVILVAALAAWPIWCAHAGYATIGRRALLAGLTVEESRVRRWLWAGRLSHILQVFTAFAWAILLLGFAARFDRWHWLVLAVDAAVVALAIGPARRALASEVREEHRAALAGRWPLTLANLALLAVAFFALDFMVVGAPDTRGLPWLAVFDQAWSEAQAGSACGFTGALLGVISAAERLTWHAAEVMIPALPQRGWKLAAWAAFLLQAGFAAYGFTRLVLGAAVLGEQAAWRGRERTALAPAFWVTAGLIAGAWIVADRGLSGFDAARIQQEARRTASRLNPCRSDGAALRAMASRLGSELDSARLAARASADAQVDERLRPIFAEAALGVDRYLDWYFTVLGEYERLGALAAGELDAMMARELERHLFGDGMLGERLERASVDIARASEAQLAQAAAALGTRLRDGVRAQPCGLGALDLAPVAALDRDVARVSAAAGGGALVGAVAVRSLGRTVAATAAGRAAAKSTVRAARGLVGKTVTKRGGSLLLSIAGAAAVCAPGGPLAILCGVVGGIVGWLGLDTAFIVIDEYLFRDAMRAEILASVAEEQALVSEALRVEHRARIDRMAAAVGASLDRAFIPARDGL